MGSIDRVFFEIQQNSVMRMRSSDPDSIRTKHWGAGQWAYLTSLRSIGPAVFEMNVEEWDEWWVVQGPLNAPSRVWPPKCGIAHIHLGSATHPENFSLISAIGKKLIFYCLIWVAYIWKIQKMLSADGFRKKKNPIFFRHHLVTSDPKKRYPLYSGDI